MHKLQGEIRINGHLNLVPNFSLRVSLWHIGRTLELELLRSRVRAVEENGPTDTKPNSNSKP
jgi:hypothetical protein